jgi:hypothetical protein
MDEPARAFNVQLPAEQAMEVEALAQVDGVSVDEEVRAALAERIAARRADPEFTARLHETIEQNRRALERLADGPEEPSGPESEAYAALAAAQDDEDRAFHAAIRARRRGEEADQ